MATLSARRERRAERRWTPRDLQWRAEAVLRPGQSIVLINVSSRAALVESRGRLRPGANTELQLAIGTERSAMKGRLERCFVAALEPLRYRGVLVFERPLAVEPRS